MRRSRATETFILGGLHRDDFEWACQQCENADYVLVRFEMDSDGYHWKAVYAIAEALEKEDSRGPLRPCLRPSINPPRKPKP